VAGSPEGTQGGKEDKGGTILKANKKDYRGLHIFNVKFDWYVVTVAMPTRDAAAAIEKATVLASKQGTPLEFMSCDYIAEVWG
jgi:uncharacterized protein (DUF1684 family)